MRFSSSSASLCRHFFCRISRADVSNLRGFRLRKSIVMVRLHISEKMRINYSCIEARAIDSARLSDLSPNTARGEMTADKIEPIVSM